MNDHFVAVENMNSAANPQLKGDWALAAIATSPEANVWIDNLK
jgi:hypothetical protein